MTREELLLKKDEALGAYARLGAVRSCEPYGNGHINDTFLVLAQQKKFILQKTMHIFRKRCALVCRIKILRRLSALLQPARKRIFAFAPFKTRHILRN